MKRPVRVLIVDDHLSSRRALSTMLACVPEVEVIGEAADGREALQLVAASQPEVVLMDVNMPIVDGLEATRLIKSQWPEIRVILLTMSARYRTKALAAGADAFLLKEGAMVDALQDAILESS